MNRTLPPLLVSPESVPALSGASFSVRGKRAFTLIEVISVMVVMMLVLTIAIGSHLMWKRHHALDTVEMQVLAQLSLARQHAITQARPTTFSTSNSVDRGFFGLSTAGNPTDDAEEAIGHHVEIRTPIGDTLPMPRRVLWVAWSEEDNPHVKFLPDGSCALKDQDPVFTFSQHLSDRAGMDPILSRSIRIHALTGLARALSREEHASLIANGGPLP